MAIYTNLPIYKSAYSLLLDVNRVMANVPRDCKYSIGQELRNKIMQIIILVYRANRVKDKVNVIMQMRETLLEVQVCIRLMCDLRHISEGCYVKFAEQTSSISKQMVAWEKSENRKKAEMHVV